jgi:hypothetical protein
MQYNDLDKLYTPFVRPSALDKTFKTEKKNLQISSNMAFLLILETEYTVKIEKRWENGRFQRSITKKI